MSTLNKMRSDTPTVETTRPIIHPDTDILETDNAVLLVADVPGIDEKSVEITIDKNTLTIYGKNETGRPEGLNLCYAECEPRDFQRIFTLGNNMDTNNIEAVVKNGVLRLTIPKTTPAQTRKITVRGE